RRVDRTSPPQGGRLAVAAAFANLQRHRRSGAPELSISPLAGEMPGRAEGGAVPPALDFCVQEVFGDFNPGSA
ncbi:MAG: hypothetical protein E5W93_19575, partial [Mesorhizobium sp.]